MSTEQNKALIHTFVQYIRQKDLESAFDQFSPDLVDHEQQPGLTSGLEGTKQFFRMVTAAFPDMQTTVDDVLADGDRVMARMTIRATHTGPFMGIPPTGKRATWSIIDIYRVAGGKIVEHWGLSDQVALLQQLGLMPPPQPSN